MNCLRYSYDYAKEVSFPFFDTSDYKTMCKVYCDGGHYIAVPPSMPSEVRPRKRRARFSNDELDSIYYQALRSGLKGERLKAYVYDMYIDWLHTLTLFDNFVSERILLGTYYVDFIGDDLQDPCFLRDVRLFVNEFVNNKMKLIAQRKKRFRRKANINSWNYFVTFTYDDDKRDEESFRVALRKSLSNLHTRRGWVYMGVFERAPDTGRLHFHGLFYIPDGEMPGEVELRREYSTKRHKMTVTRVNTFFEEKFGRNDFSPISNADLKSGNTLTYILKYIEKTGDRIVYSRGIPSELEIPISDADVCVKIVDYVEKWILFDDVLDSFGGISDCFDSVSLIEDYNPYTITS